MNQDATTIGGSFEPSRRRSSLRLRPRRTHSDIRNDGPASFVTACLAAANEAPMTAPGGFMLREQERHLLICAIESAIEVSNPGQFQTWMRGPFRMLLPHESMVCLEIDEQGCMRQTVCLHHHLEDAVTMELLDHPQHGLAVRLARSCHGDRRQSCVMNGDALKALLANESGLRHAGLLHNALIHRIALVSGPDFCVVLINLAEDRVQRCRHLLRLLSAHLKMVLSRAMATLEQSPVAPLSVRELEILRWMGEGKSSQEISGILDISSFTLKNRVGEIYRKLDVRSLEDAVARGLASQAGPPAG